MEIVQDFEMLDGIAVERMPGKYSFEGAVQHVTTAIARALAQGHDSLLVDGLGISGFSPPGIAARHEMIRHWAVAAQCRVRVAIVIAGEFIDEEKFAVLAGANFGLTSNVFETVADAIDWLLAQKAAAAASDSSHWSALKQP